MALIHDDLPTVKNPDSDQFFLGGALAAKEAFQPENPRYAKVALENQRALLRQEAAQIDLDIAQLKARKVAVGIKLSELRQK